ncbi:TIGR01213 family protein [Candidatus Methanoperedens nitroreducens]|uniref:tRNA pseudouridine synthase Pus10 n=1 Tax=Candidatus Methanoperedens nitratireducens TaxID=1392998 RepID=A0A062V6J5_9EURY|nr:tRNA pseudouridine(54/55) synthase Pus10 [Candidatus Methanoperedens nitroreducens]KCZ72917.1 TIGR01213 family protein [Candidatus Methanoperedens nitroreducens]MDJ1423155.1 tRNA pseudouridine(54/55) synthase Pus10 [Candidatus Methanoperedens sp.]
MTILDIAHKIIHEGPICDHCLGRQFAKLSTGLSNDQRGSAIRLVLVMQASADKDKALLDELEKSGENKCWVCNSLFKNLDSWAEKAVTALSDYEYDTFLVGTKVTGLLAENEEIIWAESGTTFAEPLKTELNREVGKRIEKLTGKKANLKKPQIVVLLDLENDRVELEVNSLYIYGRYRKLVRGIPQTRWPCRECKGLGCERCGFTGRMYQESVDELIKPHILAAAQCEDTAFHGAGREDIDALMLGEGRPFIVEAKKPHKRSIDLNALEAEINSQSKGKIEVTGLRFVESEAIEKIKSMKADKIYRLKIEHNTTEERLKSSLDILSGTLIKQRTPTRVLHRRADLERTRKVYSTGLESFDKNTAVIEIHCEGGLYVKELVSGDNGRTTPSITALTGGEAKVIELEVIKVDDRSNTHSSEEYLWQRPTEQEGNQDISSKKQ